ncbi:MAG TPA: L-threonylcarbamoyladenylate synthase [Ktedonobacterales bacterium]|nr:L-threonylcarbamoyladenylate synthase [Ktedonobacterales bacterium]
MDQRTLRLSVSAEGEPAERIAQAAALLRAGMLVAFPTETVYGLGADATNAEAVAAIFTAKERPLSDPLIVHIADLAELPHVARDIPPIAWELARRFWPGPLTLVLPRAEGIPPIVAAGGETVGVRMPAHPVALALLRAAGVPVAAPSANRFMRTSPTTAEHVLADLDGRIAAVLDGGACMVGVESSVLDLTSAPPRLLRPGGVTLEQLRAVLPDTEGPMERAATSEAVARAPGQMDRHYAPRTHLVVYDAAGEAGRDAVLAGARRALAAGRRVGALVPDDEAAALEALGVVVERLGPVRELSQQTRRLYAALRALDARGCDVLLAHTFAREGLGLALWDRLRRAAGGHLTPSDADE